MSRFVVLLLLIMSCSVQALEITVDDGFTHTSLEQGIHYWLTDDPEALPPAAGSDQWQQSTETLTFGFEPRTLWLTFRIVNQSRNDQTLILDVEYPLLDEVDINVLVPGQPPQRFELGDRRPAENIRILHPHLISVLTLPGGSQADLMLRIKTSATLNVPMTLWNVQDFIEVSQLSVAWYVMVYGMLVGVALYHLLIYLQLREAGFLWFSLFMFCLVGVFAFFQGVLTTYVVPGLREYSNSLLVWLYVGAAAFCALYVLRTLDVRRYRPGYARSLYALIALGGVLIALSLVISYNVMIRLLTVYALISMVVVVAVQIRRSRDRYKPAYYAMAASLFCVVGMVITLLEKTGVITSTMMTRSAGDVGFTLMAMLYALMLSYRMRWEQLERKKAQQESLNLQADLLDTQRQLNKELETLVGVRTEALEKANEQLRVMSVTDALTGLSNRRYLDEYYLEKFELMARMREPLGILLADIDHFKLINDTYGHQAGDQCLIQVADRIRQIIRNKDCLAARYGGEEFIIILPGVGQQDTLKVANSLLNALRYRPVSVKGQAISVTISIGAVAARPKGSDDPDLLLKRADELLYAAKNGGRDRVVSGELPPPQAQPTIPG